MRDFTLGPAHRGGNHLAHRLGAAWRCGIDICQRQSALRAAAAQPTGVQAEFLSPAPCQRRHALTRGQHLRCGFGRWRVLVMADDRLRWRLRRADHRPGCGGLLTRQLSVDGRGGFALDPQHRHQTAHRQLGPRLGQQPMDHAVVPALDVDRRFRRVDHRHHLATDDPVARRHLPSQQRAMVHVRTQRGQAKLNHGLAAHSACAAATIFGGSGKAASSRCLA